MKVVTRLLAFVFGLLGLVGLIVCVAGAVGVLVVKKPFQQRITNMLGEAGQALHTAHDGVGVVYDSLVKARKDLENFTKASAKPGVEPPQPTLVDRMVAERLESNIQNVSSTVNVVADASVVLNSLLGSLNEFTDMGMSQLDTNRLKDVQGSLSVLTEKSHRLSNLLGEQKGDASAKQATEMVVGLDQVIDWVAELKGKINQIQSDVNRLQARTPAWIQTGSIVLPIVLTWLAISQLAVIVVACWWFRSRKTNESEPISGGLAARIR